MGKRLDVGNLSYSLKSTELEEIFRAAGEVVNVKIVMDQETGRSKGFAFVEMATLQDAQKAIDALHGHDFLGRSLTVSEAREQAPRVGNGTGFSGMSRRGGGGFDRGRRN